ncbi:phenylacetate--CoA ligase family protein [Pseudoduganella plicata]|uniref:Adenylyltransferase n=1 Tax=Pseudoduganella plicata TaxID=321984 RepID=A0A4P7BGG1_9BURK|nr:AMP-binding protein [Pseudoduganella plicata]QBQ37333.1 phenylacetate--CoA ligase family protein [Pseudoduganella plicata]GGZ09115.1 adenylyltransferase [Pseudoduganella plicata]
MKAVSTTARYRPAPYTALVTNLLFPLHERVKQHSSVAVRKGLEASQYWPEERLRELQLRRLRALLERAAARVPYFRDLFRQVGFDPRSDVRSLADLARLPLMDKAIIRANTDRLKADDAVGLARFNTGGSSGEPLIFHIGRERVSHDVAAKWRATRWWNVDIGDPEIVVWGSPIELGTQDRVRALRDRLLRTHLLPAFEMSAAKLDSFIARIRAHRPRMLFGYPSALSHIARHAQAQGQRMDDLGIRVAFVTSERLYDEQRAQISATFGCPVANGYGGRDAGFIAHQCPEGGMHITAEDIIVEIIDPQGQPVPRGQSGEIVVTHLATGDFPFIRYRTGDIGVLGTQGCTCGRGLPLLQEIQGRTTDFMVAQDGTVMHGLALVYILRDLPQVKAFKITQESVDLTHVQVVLEAPLDAALRGHIERGFRARLGSAVAVQVEQVGAIGPEKSGKFRYVVSKVAAGRAVA